MDFVHAPPSGREERRLSQEIVTRSLGLEGIARDFLNKKRCLLTTCSLSPTAFHSYQMPPAIIKCVYKYSCSLKFELVSRLSTFKFTLYHLSGI